MNFYGDSEEELVDTEAFSSQIIDLSSEQTHALEAAGWGRRATRGWVYATEEYRERRDDTSIFGEVLTRFDPVWESEKQSRALAIWRALTDDEREEIRTLVRDIDYGKQAKA